MCHTHCISSFRSLSCRLSRLYTHYQRHKAGRHSFLKEGKQVLVQALHKVDQTGRYRLLVHLLQCTPSLTINRDTNASVDCLSQAYVFDQKKKKKGGFPKTKKHIDRRRKRRRMAFYFQSRVVNKIVLFYPNAFIRRPGTFSGVEPPSSGQQTTT